jgi:uncharacterized protein
MLPSIDFRRVIIFLLIAFGIAWITAFVIYETGGLANSPSLLPGVPGISLALVLLATIYMWAPALAHLLTRQITREYNSSWWLWPRFKPGWPFWLAAWFLPALATIIGAAFFFLLFPSYFDSSLPLLQAQTTRSGQSISMSPWTIAILNTILGILIAPIVNSVATFGEEFGWRGYLLPKLMPMGGRNAAIVMGIIWGIWHWPIIAMGHEYGFDYPAFPWLGFVTFLWFTVSASIFLSWVTLRTGTIWPAVIGHSAINGIAGVSVLFLSVKTQPPLLLGPLPVGFIGAMGFALLALIILVDRRALEPTQPRSLTNNPLQSLPEIPVQKRVS